MSLKAYQVVVRARGIYHAGIKRFTGDDWGHTYIVVADEPKQIGSAKFESIFGPGVIETTVTEKDLTGDNLWRELRVPLSEMEIIEGLAWLRCKIGCGYDTHNIWKGFILGFDLTDEEIQETRKSKEKFHCSEFNAAFSIKMKRPIADHLEPFRYHPGHIAISRELVDCFPIEKQKPKTEGDLCRLVESLSRP